MILFCNVYFIKRDSRLHKAGSNKTGDPVAKPEQPKPWAGQLHRILGTACQKCRPFCQAPLLEEFLVKLLHLLGYFKSPILLRIH